MPHLAPFSPRRPIMLVVAIASASGCFGAGDDAGTAGGPAHWRLGDPLLSIGSLEDGDDALSDVAALLVTPWEEVWVLERQSAQVRVFGMDGSLRRTVGGPGDGPGEFRSPNGLGLAGDTVLVSDARLRRTAYFLRDGSHVGGRPHPRLAEVPPHLTQIFGVPLPGGQDVVVTLPSPPLPPEFAGSASPDSVRPLYLVTADGAAPGRLGELEGASPRGVVVSTAGGEITSVMVITQPFSDQTLWTAAPDGASFTFVRRRAPLGPEAAAYVVTRVSPRGDTLYSTRRGYVPVPLHPALADSVAEEMGGEGGVSEELRAQLFVPAFHPPASRVLVAFDGGTWVRREDVPGGPVPWDVFDAGGTLVADMEVPPGVALHQVTASGVWGVRRDEFDVPYVVHYPVVRHRP